MYCKFCGKEISNNSKFCPECGKLLQNTGMDQENEIKEVISSKVNIPQEIQGTKDVGNSMTNQISQENPIKIKRTTEFVLGLVGGIIGLFSAIFVMMVGGFIDAFSSKVVVWVI